MAMVDKKTAKPKAEKLEKRVSPKVIFNPKGGDDPGKPPKGQK